MPDEKKERPDVQLSAEIPSSGQLTAGDRSGWSAICCDPAGGTSQFALPRRQLADLYEEEELKAHRS